MVWFKVQKQKTIIIQIALFQTVINYIIKNRFLFFYNIYNMQVTVLYTHTHIYTCVCVSHSFVSNSLQPHGL